MAKAPAFQLYAADLLTDTLDWTDEQVGAHVRLMCWSWINRRGIPRDFPRMTRIAPGAEAAWSVIGEKWVDGPDGTWVNEKLETTRRDNDSFRARQSEKSAKGVAAKKSQPIPVEQPTGPSAEQPVGNPLKKKVKKKTEGEVVVEGEGGKVHDAILWPSFEDWWKLYGKSADKPECAETWDKLDQETREAIMAHTELYVKANEKKFRRDPIRYLRKRTWLNEVIINENGKPTAKGSSVTPDQAARATAEYFARQRKSAVPDGEDGN